MIDLIVQIVGFLAKALGSSRDRERPERLFRDFVEPVQEDLRRIQDDYTESFMQLRQMIEDPSVSTTALESHVSHQRRRFNPLRIQAGELATAIGELLTRKARKKEPKEGSADWLLHRYIDAAIDYLYGESGEDESERVVTEDTDLRMGTRYGDFMKVVREAAGDEDKRAALAGLVSRTERELDRSWQSLVRHYSRLRAQCLG